MIWTPLTTAASVGLVLTVGLGVIGAPFAHWVGMATIGIIILDTMVYGLGPREEAA